MNTNMQTFLALELGRENVCVCVGGWVGGWVGGCVHACVRACVLQALGRSREGLNGQICLKFGTRIVWVNPWGCFFHFLKFLI